MNTTCKFRELSVFIECSTGSTPKVQTLKQYIDLLSEFGYTHLYLGLTDAYKIEGEPYFNYCRGGYNIEQLQEIDAYAREKGIELRASVQVLGHMEYLYRHDCYRELLDTNDILMVGSEEVYQFIDKIFATMSAGIQTRTIHIGMDEATNLGLGRYMSKYGYTDRRTLLMQHLKRVVEIANKYNYSCEMWSDTFFRLLQESGDDIETAAKEVRSKIPEGVSLIHWAYRKQSDESFRTVLAQHKAICDTPIFTGAAWKCIGLAPDNKYSIDTLSRQMELCQEEGVDRFMIALWSDNGAQCSIFAVLPTLFAVAQKAQGIPLKDIDKEKFKQIVGISFDDFMLVDNLNNPFYKNLDTMNSRSYWGLLSDVFLGSYDLYLDEHTNEAYEKLARRYAEVQAGKYTSLFELYSLYSKVLSIKMNLGVQVRSAYHRGDKEALEHFAKEEIPTMVGYMQEFLDKFEDWWLSENMAFGLEVNQLYYGGQMTRWNYVAKRIMCHLNDGKAIEEMEREELPACIIPETNEDRCLEMNCRNLISNCRLY